MNKVMGRGSGYIVRNSSGEKVYSVFDSKNLTPLIL